MSARGPCAAPRSFTTWSPRSSPSMSAGTDSALAEGRCVAHRVDGPQHPCASAVEGAERAAAQVVGGKDAAVGDERGDERRGGDVEGRVEDLRLARTPSDGAE